MTKFRFGGCTHEWQDYIDFDILTNDPNEYWVLTYATDSRSWYAIQKIAEDDDAMFDAGREATREEVSQMLATMPIEELPVEAFYNAR